MFRQLAIFIFFVLSVSAKGGELPTPMLALIKNKPVSQQIATLDSLAAETRNKDFRLSVKLSEYSLQLSKTAGEKESVVKTYLMVMLTYRKEGNFDTALLFVDSAKTFAFNNQVVSQYSNVFDREGLLYMRMANYEKATGCFYKAISYSEKTNDSTHMSSAFGHLGSVSFYRYDYRSAIKFYKRSLSLLPARSDKRLYVSMLDNIGLGFSNLKRMDSALIYQRLSVTLIEELHDSTLMAEAYINIGSTLLAMKNFDTALNYFSKASAINSSLNNTYGIMLSNLYLGRLYLQSGKPEKALPYLETSYSIATKLKIPSQVKETLSSLTTAFDNTGNFKAASDRYKLLIEVIELIYKEENSKAVNELSTQYETEKKQQQIALLTADKALQHQRIRQDQYIKRSVGTIACLLLLLSIIFIYRFREKKKDNQKLIEKNNAIAAQKTEIEHQREELQNKNTEITDSINYANIIQRSVLPSMSSVRKLLPQSFIYFQPKDIISGDFYWIHQHKGYIYYAVADCTGHGVPGAMMSMLGASLLNQIILTSGVELPSDILKDLHQQLLITLNESVAPDRAKDGMDIALLRIDPVKKELLFSGANRPLYIFKNNELSFIRGDKFSIGDSSKNEHVFQSHPVDFNEALQLYLFTDGIPDQFGGPYGKKFMIKRLTDFFLSTSSLSLHEQQRLFNELFNGWKKGYEQTDDTTLVCVRLS